jgi:pyruvate kinase
MRRTKIVATLGPASRDPDTLRKLIESGVDVFRLNFAHDTPAAHRDAAELTRRIAHEVGRVVGILVDLPGPKMRTGPLENDEVSLRTGQNFILAGDGREGDETRVSTSVEGLADMVDINEEIFLADGEIVLRVTGVEDKDVVTEVVRGGILRNRKGMHLPHSESSVEAFTAEDHAALMACLDFKADLVGLSFVRDAEDVERARAALPEEGHRPLLVAKIETASGVENLEAIAGIADVVMVARGDLGIQTPLHRVPILQKEIIRTCNEYGVPVITATQMLESMTDSLLPTRAEVTDVANAVLDGTDALMLSEETAVGHNPLATVETMAQIAETAEIRSRRPGAAVQWHPGEDRVSWAVAHAAVQAAEDLKVAAILCPTRSGATPRRVAAFRPRMPVVGLTSETGTLGALSISWGVIPVEMPPWPEARDERDDIQRTVDAAVEVGVVTIGQLALVVSGSPGRRAGRTDSVRVVRI